MDDSESEARIVVLSQDSSLAWSPDGRGAGVVCVHAPSGYEAAAELLAAATTALVVDLRLLAGRHLRLLELARDLHVEVFAVGSLPIGMTAEDLSGVRLMARGDLPAAVRALAHLPLPAAADGPSHEDRPIEPAEAARAVQLTSAKSPEPAAAVPEAAARPAAGPLVAVEAEKALALMGLPPVVKQALDGSGRRSKGKEARRQGGQHENGSPRRESERSAGAEEPGGGLLSAAELNALLGDDQ